MMSLSLLAGRTVPHKPLYPATETSFKHVVSKASKCTILSNAAIIISAHLLFVTTKADFFHDVARK